MNDHLQNLFTALEFDKLLDKISGFASSALGKERVLQTEPLPSEQLLKERLAQVHDMLALLRFDDHFPIHGMRDIRPAFKRLAIEGSRLEIEELVDVVQTLEVAQGIYRYLGARQSKYKALNPFFRELHPFVDVIRAIKSAIDLTSKEIKDTASPDLNKIRRELHAHQERVRKRLQQLVEQYKDFLQEPIITMRQGRLVIPLREDCKGKVKGFIHDRSATGATLFIEPMEILELNNQIRELQIAEKREVERILLQLSDLLRQRVQEIRSSFDALCELDALYAVGKFAVAFEGTVAKLHPRRLELKTCYHPLLRFRQPKKGQVVPLTVTMDDENHLIVITGPNAGGKTVALKTIGLSCLMTRCGLPILARENSCVPFFDIIFADIGDLQSIEQDLSTFSAHVSRLAELLRKATVRSLVLIDEIGTGTDPDEGSALAMAVLETLHKRKTFTVVTTHQGVLKAFAHNFPGALNASMAFDDATLQPTYQFRIGIPGSSYAFEIAQRHGIPDEVIQSARERVGKEQTQLEEFILELEQKLNRYQQLLQKAEIKKTELEGLTKLYKQRLEKLQKEEKKLKRKALEDSQELIKNANRIIEETVKKIRTEQASRESIREARKRVSELRQQIREGLETVEEPKTFEGERPERGDLARWEKMNITGTVVSDPDDNGNVWLEAGDMKVHIPLKQLIRVEKKKTFPFKGIRSDLQTTKNLRTELDLRGMTMEEAQPVLEKYLDQAYLYGLDRVRIIHGKGTGALRKKVNEYLKRHPKVARTHAAAWNEGDIGVTVVTFKEE